MNSLKRSLQIITLAGLLALGLVSEPLTLVRAQLASVISKLPKELNFDPPLGMGSPSGREGGATRGSCEDAQPTFPEGKKELSLLLPASGLGTTAAKYPTFFWYLPKTSAKQMEFVLMDEEEEEVYSTIVAIAGQQPGIMSVQIPPSSTLPLKIGRVYRWSVSLYCPSTTGDRSGDALKQGRVVRVQPNPRLPDNIKTRPLQQQLVIYAKYRLWHETLTTLAQLRRLSPNDQALKNDWARLLKSVGLNDIAGERMFVQSADQRHTQLTHTDP